MCVFDKHAYLLKVVETRLNNMRTYAFGIQFLRASTHITQANTNNF